MKRLKGLLYTKAIHLIDGEMKAMGLYEIEKLEELGDTDMDNIRIVSLGIEQINNHPGVSR